MAKSLAASRSVQGLAPEPAAPIEHVARAPEPGPARQAAARGGDGCPPGGDSRLEKKWTAVEAQVKQLEEELKIANRPSPDTRALDLDQVTNADFIRR